MSAVTHASRIARRPRKWSAILVAGVPLVSGAGLVGAGLVGAGLVGAGLGCARDPSVGEMTPVELSAAMSSSAPPAVFDANGDRVRRNEGIIPGATLLESARGYDLAKLPAAKADHVVFYCANTWCSAARTAAGRAREAGHTHVSVLPAGIKGWKAAGFATDALDARLAAD
ncbi:MAG: rhodanese-like domain-containing protein [Myxococcota bacterium]